jgi:hypothetical protein
MGPYGYPNMWHYGEVFHGIGFNTTMAGNVYALYREVYEFAKKSGRSRDFLMIDLEIDVFALLNRWINRLNQFKTPNELEASESYWNEHIQMYTFGKKTLIKAINVSRTFGIQTQISKDGAGSRVFRNALTFSSHMSKIQNHSNEWGGDTHEELDMDLFLSHKFNEIIHDVPIPETW